VVFESRIWHRTGFNRTADQRRAGVFGWYTKPIYRQQENWFLSLDPIVRRFASDTLLTLLGYIPEPWTKYPPGPVPAAPEGAEAKAGGGASAGGDD